MEHLHDESMEQVIAEFEEFMLARILADRPPSLPVLIRATGRQQAVQDAIVEINARYGIEMARIRIEQPEIVQLRQQMRQQQQQPKAVPPRSIAGPVLVRPIAEECSICLKTTYKKQATAQCGHACCNTCMQRIVKKKPCCPMCRAAVVELTIQDVRKRPA